MRLWELALILGTIAIGGLIVATGIIYFAFGIPVIGFVIWVMKEREEKRAEEEAERRWRD